MSLSVSEQSTMRPVPESDRSAEVSYTLCTGKLVGLVLTNVRKLRQAAGLSTPSAGTPLGNVARLTNELRDRIMKKKPETTRATPVRTGLDTQATMIQERSPELKTFLEAYIKGTKQAASEYTNPYCGENPLITGASEFLAKLLFVVDRDPKFAEPLNKKNGLDAQKAEINRAFDAAMKSATAELVAHQLISNKFGIVSADSIRDAFLPRAIASLLITSTGVLNLGILHAVQKALFGQDQTPAQNEIIRVLGQCAKDKNLQTLLESISAPPKDSIAASVVATSCGLGSTEAVTDVHAKRAFLAALLSRPATLPESCGYAMSIGMFVKELRLDTCAEDLKALVTSGSLVRSIDGEQMDFELDLQNVEAPEVDAYISSDKSGKQLRDFPGLKLAAQLMGIAPGAFEGELKSALARINSDKTTLRRLVSELSGGNEKVAQLGLAALSVQSTNILLRAWQDVLARIAEERPALIMRAHVLHAVQAAFYTLFPVKSNDATELAAFSDKNVGRFIQALLVELDDDLQIDYDAEHFRVVIRDVRNPEEFRELIKSKITVEKLRELFQDDAQAAFFASRLDSFVTSDAFLRQVVVNFDSTNAEIRPEDSLQSLRFAPWGASYGTDPFDFVRTYLGQDFKPVHSVRASTPQELLQHLLDFAKTHNAAQATDVRYLVATPHSPFTLLTDEPTFSQAILSTHSAADYMAKYMAASRVLGLEKVEVAERDRMISWVEKTFISPDLILMFKNEVSAIPATASLKELHDALTQIAVKYKGFMLTEGQLPEGFDENVSADMRNFLLEEGLSAEKRTRITGMAIHFAEVSRTVDDARHLCFYPDVFNPGAIRLGLISTTGNKLQDLKTERWITPQAWELFQVQSSM